MMGLLSDLGDFDIPVTPPPIRMLGRIVPVVVPPEVSSFNAVIAPPVLMLSSVIGDSDLLSVVLTVFP